MGNACSSNKAKHGTTVKDTKSHSRHKDSQPHLNPNIAPARNSVTATGAHREHMTPQFFGAPLNSDAFFSQRNMHSPAIGGNGVNVVHDVNHFVDPVNHTNNLTNPLPTYGFSTPIQETMHTKTVYDHTMPVTIVPTHDNNMPIHSLPIPTEGVSGYNGHYADNNGNNFFDVNHADTHANNFFDGDRFDKHYNAPDSNNYVDYTVREPVTMRDVGRDDVYVDNAYNGVGINTRAY